MEKTRRNSISSHHRLPFGQTPPPPVAPTRENKEACKEVGFKTILQKLEKLEMRIDEIEKKPTPKCQCHEVEKKLMHELTLVRKQITDLIEN